MMRVLMLSNHCCIRVIKESLALRAAGVDLFFLANRVANRDLVTICEPSAQWRTRADIGPLLQQAGPLDLIHVHNEPTWLVNEAVAARPDVPVVLDCHDLDTMRTGQPTAEELDAFRLADGFLMPSATYHARAPAMLGVAGKPAATAYSMCPREATQLEPIGPRRHAIAYEGGIRVGADHNGHLYRDYRDTMAAIVAEGYNVHTFSAGGEPTAAYSELGVMCGPVLPYLLLLRTLATYDWGLVCPGHACPAWDAAMPNKLFEYIAAGIPCLCWDAVEAGTFIQHYGLGLVLDGPRDLSMVRYAECERIRHHVRKVRGEFVMENQTATIMDLYRAAIAWHQVNAHVTAEPVHG